MEIKPTVKPGYYNVDGHDDPLESCHMQMVESFARFKSTQIEELLKTLGATMENIKEFAMIRNPGTSTEIIYRHGQPVGRMTTELTFIEGKATITINTFKITGETDE